DAEPFVKRGVMVNKGDKLCIIEAMKVMNEITAPCDGIIKEIYVENEAMVEYNQELFLIGEDND
ncbi:MAG: acetyl-CoA carboxylase, biotin carboxyl carrier protein, partial [Acholeplasmatales bacterium]|nr:acetyl-CoA carboxylase, biotin carboxyl carrier protein [Acholeplasmatales bacterium]